MEAIATHDLSKIYKGIGKSTVKSLDQLNLTVGEHEVFGFLGRNGAGKTTTIKILCSLLKASTGEAQVFGENVRSRAARRLIGYLPEQPYFYEYLTPKETIDFYGRLQGLDSATRKREWDKLAALLDLGDIADRHIKGFSKGMRQRVGFAVALVGDPPLLILDEPMSGLDPIGRRQIRELMVYLREQKKTLFFSSHVLSDVEQVCDRVGILVKGKLVRTGRIDMLLSAQQTEVEVVATGLEDATCKALAGRAVRSHVLEEHVYFVLDSPETANGLVRDIHKFGGKLVEYTPLKETLEEYFMREQEAVLQSKTGTGTSSQMGAVS